MTFAQVVTFGDLPRPSQVNSFASLADANAGGGAGRTNFYIGGKQFTITYFGATDNDVVLTRIPTPPRPALLIPFQPASVRLLWPASFTDYALQFSTNLSGADWMPNLPLPVIIGTNNVVTNAAGDARKFYRLFKP